VVFALASGREGKPGVVLHGLLTERGMLSKEEMMEAERATMVFVLARRRRNSGARMLGQGHGHGFGDGLGWWESCVKMAARRMWCVEAVL